MKWLIVAAPCICRSSIHAECYEILLKMLECVAHRTYFVVNIDPCSGTNNESQIETESHLKSLFDRFGVHYEFHKPRTACFFTATKRILSRVNDLFEVYPMSDILWFEDDKKITKDIKIEHDLSRTDDYVKHFWRASAHCPTFHPTLWSARAAQNYLIPSILSETASADPELLMMHYWRKHYKHEIPLTHYNSFSTDIGREWQSKNGIKKWIREDMVNRTVTYI